MKFKKGDRVRIYSGVHGVTLATVGEVRPDGLLSVQGKDFTWRLAHPKQCRRLKRKCA